MAIAETQNTRCDEGTLIAWNPATAQAFRQLAETPRHQLPDLVARAREALPGWSRLSLSKRLSLLTDWYKRLARNSRLWADRATQEIGKPRAEALGEIAATLDQIRWTLRNAPHVLHEQRRSAGWQRLMMLGSARVEHAPVGVVAIFGTWNYPLLLNASTIAAALAAGNGVIWKPSELAAALGADLAASIEEIGLPEGVFSVVHGKPEIGQSLALSNVDKIVYTGGVSGGRAVMAAAAQRGVPCCMELSGFDPALVLPDASRPDALRAILWSSFVGAGQACVAAKRIYVVGDDVRSFAHELALAADRLRLGDPSLEGTDVGPMIRESARDRFHETLQVAIAQGAELLTAREPYTGLGWFARPTVILADDNAPEDAIEGIFGPIALVRGFATVESAIDAANRSSLALAASIWTRDRKAARAIASRLHCGVVTINDAVTPTAHASAPFGGSRASGFGRVHGPEGLLEFTQTRSVHARQLGGPRPQIYPYDKRTTRLMDTYVSVCHSLFRRRS